jgi:hypothetical protein
MTCGRGKGARPSAARAVGRILKKRENPTRLGLKWHNRSRERSPAATAALDRRVCVLGTYLVLETVRRRAGTKARE